MAVLLITATAAGAISAGSHGLFMSERTASKRKKKLTVPNDIYIARLFVQENRGLESTDLLVDVKKFIAGKLVAATMAAKAAHAQPRKFGSRTVSIGPRH